MAGLHEHPVSALHQLADKGVIPRPMYTVKQLDGEVRVVAQIPDSINGAAVAPTMPEARRLAAAELLRIVLKRVCPVPERPRYATREAAQHAIDEWQAMGKGKPLHRLFPCNCGWWHTSGKQGNRNARRRRARNERREQQPES